MRAPGVTAHVPLKAAPGQPADSRAPAAAARAAVR